MDNNNKKCSNCGSYKAYYTRGINSYNNAFCGFCNKNAGIVKYNEYCANWSKQYNLKRIRQGLRNKVLQKMSEDLSMIRQILEDEQNEK